jgi:hypothetical protein
MKVKIIQRKIKVNIATIIEQIEKPKGFFTNKEQSICVEIIYPSVTKMTAFKYNNEGKKKLLKYLKEELNL